MTHLDDPFTGMWTLNLEKSSFSPNHSPMIAEMRWERTIDSYRMRAEGKKEDGKIVVDQATFVLDGRERPVTAAPGFTASSEQPDPHTVRTFGRKDGKVVSEGVYAVPEDRVMLTAMVRGVDAQHRPFQSVVVWDRQVGKNDESRP
jgi:hypothetical protein